MTSNDLQILIESLKQDKEKLEHYVLRGQLPDHTSYLVYTGQIHLLEGLIKRSKEILKGGISYE